MNVPKDYLVCRNPWGWNIEQKNLYYTDMGDYEGMQCNIEEDDPNYKKILEYSREIVKLIKKIEEINEGQDDSKRVQPGLEGIRRKDQQEGSSYFKTERF